MNRKKVHHDLCGKHDGCAKPNIAMVTGQERGVPFRVFFKRMVDAEEVAIKTHGELQDLRTLRRRKWVAGEWRDA